MKLVGRQAELARLTALFGAGVRLVTLHGPAGVGKTALARAFAASLDHDVVFCDLTAAKDYDEACFVLANALDVSLGGAALGSVLAGALGHRLVVLDGAEGIAAAVARLSMELLLGNARVLVTSRELLRLREEAAFDVAPLEPSAAVELLLARAQHVVAHPPELHDAAELALVLEGLPLAIELAAARLGVMTARELTTRLREELDVLSVRWRDAPPRAASLRGAFETSLGALDDGERSVLEQCTVFRGGFTLKAAEVVITAKGAMDTVEALVGKSLLRRWEEGGVLRFGPYEILRRLTEQRMTDSARATVVASADRHARYYAELGSAWDRTSWYGAPDVSRLRIEHDNLLAAHRHARERGTPEVLETFIGLYPIHAVLGPYDALVRIMDDPADARIADAADPALASRFYLVRGRLLQSVGRRDDGAASFEKSLHYARKGARADLAARALAYLGFARRTQGAMTEARERFEASVTLFREQGDGKSEAVVLSGLAALDLGEGNLDSARATLERAIDNQIRANDPSTAAMMRVDLGIVLQEMGDLEGARAVYEAALVAHRATGNRRHEAITLGYLGTLEDEQDRLPLAKAALMQATETMHELGDPKFGAVFGAALAAVLARLGEHDAAVAALARASANAKQHGEARVLAAVALHEQRVGPATAERGTALGMLQQSDDVRFAARMLDRARPVVASIPTTALRIAEDSSWIELPTGTRIDLTRRTVQRRLLTRLLRERLASPGTAVSIADLVLAGWPGEKLAEGSAQNRLHVALATLRADGLRELLLRGEGGYMLDPKIDVRIERL